MGRYVRCTLAVGQVGKLLSVKLEIFGGL